MRFPGKQSLGTEELIRAGKSLRMLFLQHKNSPPPRVRNQAGKAGSQSNRCKKEVHRQQKQGHEAWEEHRDAVRMSRDWIRKVEDQVTLNLARAAKSNKKEL